MSFLSYENFIDPILRNIRQLVPGFSGMKAGDRVLDVCCGTGAQVFEYARRGILATGIDKEKSMLRVALENKDKLNSENASFCLADATALPFDDNTFDYVSVSFGLHEKERDVRDKVVSEMKRAVRREGHLIFIDYRVPLPKNIWALSARAIEFIAGGSHYRGFKDYINNGGLETILAKNSLVKEKETCVKSGIALIVKARAY